MGQQQRIYVNGVPTTLVIDEEAGTLGLAPVTEEERGPAPVPLTGYEQRLPI